ncbi:SH3 domain-containing protein [Variovorax sp. JS1663]|uniref:SH3 domain-containing protein n=1 Tax=Variovorax sp. JS1663 TaxID=1851577 RepID=UPI000B349C63|nr:SH3 domain-containing protein [Variovorax sp. JS1663]
MKNILGRRWIAIGLLAFALPLAASAQQAFSRGTVNLRAGPSGDYPLVARLGPGQPFEVLGCTRGYSWCDVVLPDGLRGWLFAASIDYAYEDRRVPLASYGAMIGVPIVGFAIGNYWGDHYRDRSWYGEQRWWHGRPPPPPVAGWRPVPAPRPDWRPNPWHDRDPGYRPRPDPGFRPQPGWQQPPPAPRPPPDHGFRPPRPDRDFRQPRPDQAPAGRPPQFGQPPAMHPGHPGRPPQAQPAPPAAFPPGSVPRAAADMRQRQMDRINRPVSPSADRP